MSELIKRVRTVVKNTRYCVLNDTDGEHPRDILLELADSHDHLEARVRELEEALMHAICRSHEFNEGCAACARGRDLWLEKKS